MPVFKSDIATLRDSSSAQIARGSQAHVRVVFPTYEAPAAIANNDIIVFAEIPVDARITSLTFWCDDLGTTGTLNFGFYAGNADVANLTDAAAVDEDALATAVDVFTAALANVELRFEVKDLSTANQAAWELAGLTTRPEYGTFLICATAAAATTAAGGMALRIEYTE